MNFGLRTIKALYASKTEQRLDAMILLLTGSAVTVSSIFRQETSTQKPMFEPQW
jgi:hypothetical protein